MIAAVEFGKAILKFKEYQSLISKENIKTYVNFEAYKDFKGIQQIKENHVYLVRSKKRVPKIPNF